MVHQMEKKRENELEAGYLGIAMLGSYIIGVGLWVVVYSS